MNLKNTSKFIGLYFCLNFLYGCSVNTKNISSLCTINVDGVIMTSENFSENDTIIKSIQTTKISNENLDSNGQNYITETVDEYKKLYNIQGVEYKTEFTDSATESFIEEITIDYKKASYDELVKTGLIIQSPDNNKNISLQKTIKLFESQGYSCD